MGNVIIVIDKDWSVCWCGLALSTPLDWYNRAILNYPKFKEMDLWNDSLMSSEIWNCLSLLFFQVLEDTWRNLGGVKLFSLKAKYVFKKNPHIRKFWRHISIYVRRYRLWQKSEEDARKEEGALHRGNLTVTDGTVQEEDEKKKKTEKKMWWDWTTELFFLLRLELLIKQQTNKQKKQQQQIDFYIHIIYTYI